MVTYFRRWCGRWVVALMFVAGGGGSPTDLFAVKAAHATILPSGATDNPSDLPAMAAARVKAAWPGWTITSSALKAGGFVTVAGRNAKGVSGVWSCEVVPRVDRAGKTTWYIGAVRGPS